MTEEVKEKLFSEMGQGEPFVRTENIWVIRRTGVPYGQYWSEKTQKFGPLLEATSYTSKPEMVNGGELVDYRELVGVK